MEAGVGLTRWQGAQGLPLPQVYGANSCWGEGRLQWCMQPQLNTWVHPARFERNGFCHCPFNLGQIEIHSSGSICIHNACLWALVPSHFVGFSSNHKKAEAQVMLQVPGQLGRRGHKMNYSTKETHNHWRGQNISWPPWIWHLPHKYPQKHWAQDLPASPG